MFPFWCDSALNILFQVIPMIVGTIGFWLSGVLRG